MKLTFLGGADEVGASSILLEIAGRRLLIDAGIRPSPKARWGLAGDQLPDLSRIDQAGGIDAVLATHAHTDHTGALELVTGHYPAAPVYATPVTIALARVLHQDSRRIMQSRLEEEGELPLFDDVAVEKLMAAFVPVPFGTRLALGEGLAATYFPAGHIPGAAMIGLESDEGRVLISGDISISAQRTVDGARPPAFAPDVLVMESTYGGRLHANRAAEERRLVETVGEVVSAGGKVLIPAFALGRAQELLLILAEFRRRGELPPVPVWADGLVRAICQAYAGFSDTLPLPLQERDSLFFDEIIRPVENNGQRNDLIWQADPAVIVASSGMLAGGPSLSYARSLAGQPQHAILLTGYQDEEAPGRRLQEVAERGYGTIRLGKDKVDVRCRLGTYSLSAHADEGQIISLVEALDPSEVVLVHGDEAARTGLAGALDERGRRVTLPRAGQGYEFHFAATHQPAVSGVGHGRPDPRSLWLQTGDPSGDYFDLGELARMWWGKGAKQHQSELAAILARDDLYFVPDPRRPGVYRARPRRQVELSLQRRAQMAAYRQAAGQWLAVRGPGRAPFVARCVGTTADRLLLAAGDDEEDSPESVWPEEVLAVLGKERPGPEILRRFAALEESEGRAAMEPNQALAYANGLFPPEARLRRCGYRLDERILVLAFDFPDAAREQYAGLIAALETGTGWQVEVGAEANQNALASLARTMLPEGWAAAKEPAIHRTERQVTLAIAPAEGGAAGPDRLAADRQLADLAVAYRAATGYELILSPATTTPHPAPPAVRHGSGPSAPWEINAAYAAIREALAGSTLYRTSLKGSEILLSFISPQVGERYRAEIAALEERIGWPLAINPQPNQGAILEAARTLAAEAGWVIMKGPGIYPANGQVTMTLAGELSEAGYAAAT